MIRTIYKDPRIALMADTSNPVPLTEQSRQIQSLYEPILLPDGTGSIPTYQSAGEVSLQRLGPPPQTLVSEPIQPQPLLPVTQQFPLPYGQKLPAPSLPTGTMPDVKTRSDINVVESLIAPRYLDEKEVTPAKAIEPYTIPNRVTNAVPVPTSIPTTEPNMSPDIKVFDVNAAAPDYRTITRVVGDILPYYQAVPPSPVDQKIALPVRVTEYVRPPTEPIPQWYQDIPAAPGAPSVPAPVAPESVDFNIMQMDNGAVTYVPTNKTSVRASANAPSSPSSMVVVPATSDISVRASVTAPISGEDTRYTKALAADGSIVNVARGYPLPVGITAIPGVTNMNSNSTPGFVNIQTTSGQTFSVPGDVIATPVPSNKLPGWLLPVGIGIALFLLLGNKKKQEG